MFSRTLLFFFCMAFISGGVWAAEKEIEVGSFYSHYVWRGIRLSEGPVYQSSVTVSSRGVTLNIWQNFDIYSAALNEIDLTACYGREMSKFKFEFGLTHYGMFDKQDSDEIFSGITANYPLQPSLKAFFDVNAGKGAFLQASAGHRISFSSRFPLNLSASMGVVFRNSFMGVPDSGREFTGLHNAEIIAASPIELNNRWRLKLQAGASTPLSRNARQAIIDSEACRPGQHFCNGTIIYGGATLTYSF